jgi:two-component sensor histidine kinase
MFLLNKYIGYFIGLFCITCFVLGNTLNAQGLQKYDEDLHKIDSIVSTGYTLDALELVSEIYPLYRQSDSTSNKFKRLCTNYLFILENLNLNEKAIEFSNELIRLDLGNEVKANIFITLSLIHEKASNKELAKEYLNLAKPLIFNSSIDSLKAVWFIRSSSYNHQIGNNDSAQFFAEKAYLISKKIGNKSTTATAAFLHSMFIQDDSLKLEVQLEGLDLFLAIKDYRLGMSQCISIYFYYKSMGNKEKALEYLTKAQEIGSQTSVIDIKIVLFGTLKKKYAAEGDFEQAYKYADSVGMVMQLIFDRSDRLNLISSDFKFKTNRLKNELDKAEKIVQEKEIEKQKLIYSIAVTLAFFILLLFIAYDQRNKRKTANQNQKIIKEQNDELVTANKENKLLMQEMNHRIKNNFSTLSALLEIQANQEANLKVKEALQKSLERIDLLAELHKRILNFDSQQLLAADEVILDVINGQLYLFNTQKDNISIELDPIKLRTKAVTALTFIINELLTNALKHGQKGESPIISISLKNKEDEIWVSIGNSGSVMPENYRISNQNSSGLYITDLLVKQLGGQLRWECTNDSTTFYFSFLA